MVATPRDRAIVALRACGGEPAAAGSPAVLVISPIDGGELLELAVADASDAAAAASAAFHRWWATPRSARAEFVASLGRQLAERRAELAELVTIETGKLSGVAATEVAAAVDACDSARAAEEVAELGDDGASTPGRFETRVPVGPVAVVGSFETPLLDWAATVPVALACGCPVIWSPATPLVASAVAAIVEATRRERGVDVVGLHTLALGEPEAVDGLAGLPGIELVQSPAPLGLNVAIVTDSADPSPVARAVSAATVAGGGRSPAGLRLLLVDERVAGELEDRLLAACDALQPGSPLTPGVDLAPLRDIGAYRALLDAGQAALAAGGELLREGERCQVEQFPDAFYAKPALVRAPTPLSEIPAPILFLATYRDLDEAIARRDAVPHRWSAIFGDEESVARFLASPGSARSFVGVNACPHETDLIGGDSWSWLCCTRRVVRRFAGADGLRS